MTEAEQRADVSGPQLETSPVRIHGFMRERGRRERRAAQVVRLRIGGVERDGPIEAFQCLAIPILFLAQPAKIENSRQIIRRQRDRLFQQAFGLAVMPRLELDERQQSHGIDIVWIVTQKAPIESLGFLEPPRLLMFRGQRHEAALG